MIVNCMLSLGLRSYEMELRFSDRFKSYEMELETYVHVKIENQLGFHELQLHAITRVEKLSDGTRVL